MSITPQEIRLMTVQGRDMSVLVKEIRGQLDLSQEDLARELGVSYATVNRWENSVSKPSRLARARLETFCRRMTSQGRLRLQKGDGR